MPLRGSASSSAFDVATRKVPSLALVPRSHLQHVKRGDKKAAGSTQLPLRKAMQQKQQDERVNRVGDGKEDESSSPPRAARRQPLGDLLDVVEEQSTSQQKSSPGRHESDTKEEDGEGGNSSDDDNEAELRLGERFLNMMALMACLASQSLGDDSASAGSPTRLARTNTERTRFARTNPERTLNPIASALAPPSPPPPPSQQKSPARSPKHAIREVADRLPRALQGQLTFDICMLLPAPLNDRQTPLRSPIRRKRLRKRVRRRRLRRRTRRTWQASHANWPPHASVDYIVNHSRQDIAGISATRFVEKLGEQKVSAQALPRVLSMPLPLLRRINTTATKAADELGNEDASEDGEPTSEDDEPTSEAQDSESEVDEEARHVDVGESSQDDEGTSLPGDDTSAPSPPQEETRLPLESRTVAAPARKRPLYHQPAWISPELHAWLVASGLFTTKPRRELLSAGV